MIHDLTTGAVQYVVARGSGYFRIAGYDVAAGLNAYEKMSINTHDPLSASTEVTVLARTSRAEIAIDVKAHSKLTADTSHFLLESGVEVSENQRNVFTRSRSDRIPREYL